jgi:WD40-like Beta Propeller Repeat
MQQTLASSTTLLTENSPLLCLFIKHERERALPRLNACLVDNRAHAFLSSALQMNRQSKKQLAVGSWQLAVKSKSTNAASRACSLLPTICCLLFLILVAPACRNSGEKGSVRPNSLRDVGAVRLAYSFAPDADAPPGADTAEGTKLKAIEDDFDTRRKDDRLLRTVVSPDGMRALALYDTGETQEGEFRIDMYSAEGKFLRNLTPTELSGAFAPMVAWSPDGNYITFIGRKSQTPQTPPDMIPETVPDIPQPAPSVAPQFGPVAVFDTEQIYICNRDGFEMRPLTTRNGLIYFHLAWSPDNHALVALACREDEWEVRERESKLPAGRPRLVETDGRERLLDDGLTEAGPVWSPDSSKVAAGFETEVKIYDTVATQPTQASIPLREALLKASADYDEKNLESKNKTSENKSGKPAEDAAPQTSGTPVSFNPIVRLAWPEDKTLFIQTAYIRIYSTEPVVTFQRWHRLNLSIQAGALKNS